MDRIRIAYSDDKSCMKAYTSIYKQLTDGNDDSVPLAILFASDFNNFNFYSKSLHADFNNSEVMGMTTYTVMSSKGHSQQGISAIAIYSGIECFSGILHEIKRYPLRYTGNIQNAVKKITSYDNCCCFEFTSAFCQCEELVIDTYKKVLNEKNIPIFGGSAGCPPEVSESYVSLNGEVFQEASVFMIIKNLNGRIGIFKENLFKPTKHFFTATDVDCDERAVYEYDDIPAAEAIANALNVPITELNNEMKMHPVGRIEKNNIYITESNYVGNDSEITYYSRIYNRTKVVLLEVDDMEQVFNTTAAAVKDAFSSISFTLVINCLSRSKYFIENNKFDYFSNTLTENYNSYIGFSGYGEQTDFEHLNQTMLLAVFE